MIYLKILKTYSLILFSLILAPCIMAKGPKSVEDYDRIFAKAEYYLDKSQYDKAVHILTEIPITDISAADDTTKVFYNVLLGKAYFLGQDNNKAEQYLGEAVTLHERLRFKDPSYIDMLVLRAFASDALGKREEAMRWYRKALLKGKVVEHNGDLDNCCYLNLGNIYNETGDYALAKEFYDKIQWQDSLKIVEIHGDYYGKAADRYQQLANSNNWVGAKAVNDSLTNYCLTKYGETDNYYLCCLQSESVIQLSLGDNEKAMIPYKETVNIGKKYSLISSYVGHAYCQLINLYCRENKIDEALALLSETTRYIKKLSDENINEIEPYFYIGQACVDNSDFHAGITALEIFLKDTPNYLQWTIPYAINDLSWAYLNIEKYQEAVDLLIPILSHEPNLSDTNHPVLPYLYKTLGCSLYFLNRKEEAISFLNEAARLSNGDMRNDTLINKILNEGL